MKAMKCFYFSHGPKKEETTTETMSSSSIMPSTMSSNISSSVGSGFTFSSASGTSGTSIGSVGSYNLTLSPQSQHRLRTFTFAELKAATNDFNRSLVIGQGGFGSVFKGAIKSLVDPHKKIDVAVKTLSRRGLQGHKEWLTEVNVLGAVDHPNLVKLIGYCAEDDERGMQRLLVYEYMPNKSVCDHLSSRSSKPLPWKMRLRIALDSARGLTYLHEEMTFQIIFRDFKTSNILLDEQWNSKLSDFGLARQGPSEGLTHVSTAVVGTIGYAAPEYMQTGHLTAKSDVWSYGIVLYELITGRRPIDRNRPKAEQKLLEWVKPHISNYRKFPMIIDPRIAGNCDLKSAQQLAAVANKCLVRNPKSRPKMSELLTLVEGIVESAEMEDPMRPLRNYSSYEVEREERRER